MNWIDVLYVVGGVFGCLSVAASTIVVSALILSSRRRDRTYE